jgi:putative ABC transport system permease protein
MNDFHDRVIYVPIINAKNIYGSSRSNYQIEVSVNNAANIDEALSEGIGLFRQVRGLKSIEENDFEVEKSDEIIGMIKDSTKEIRWALRGIGIITLLGAAIGLMNIMLVSVTERTKEIGIRKALGATKANIITQFMTESIIISILGGLVGILGSILIAFIIVFLMKGSFVIPWASVFFGFAVCAVVGLGSGLYPAVKAARLDPIVALRYE